MKVKTSEYITNTKECLKILLNKLLERFEYVSILATDSVGKVYSVSRTGTNIAQHSLLSERGFCVKIIDKGVCAEYSFTDISTDKIDELADKAAKAALYAQKACPEGISTYKYTVPEDEPCIFCEGTEYEEDPSELGDEKIVELLTDISNEGRAFDERIVNCVANCSYQKYTKLFLSRNKDMTQNVMWVCGMINVSAVKDEIVQSSYKPVSLLGGTEIMRSLKGELKNACETAIALLDSEPIEPGEYDCICEPDVTGMIVHEAFGHGVEMDMFVKDRAQAKDFIGKQVASPLITMHDGARTISQVASYFFDDEGVLGQDTVIIDKGILVSGICDSLAAEHLKAVPTGNGRRQDTTRKAYTRMTNTIFEAGDSKVEDMIASIRHGFLLCEASSGMEDPKNWGIQLMVNMAKEIKDGKLTGKIYSPIVLTGYVPDLLKSISMVSEKISAGGSGFCGKGYKEWVKVSDGGPYIKARIRLG